MKHKFLLILAMAALAFPLLIASPSYATPIDLGTAGNFAILAKTGISTTSGSDIVGDIGASPIAASGITGFDLTMDSSGEFSTSSLVTGKVYAADYTSPTPTDMTTAISDMETAYTTAAGISADFTGTGSGNISGLTLDPGVYKWGTGVTIQDDVTLSGAANDFWIFQIAETLDIASATSVLLDGGAQASNIIWQVADTTTLGTTSHFEGIILGQTLIEMLTGASLNGKALAQAAVTLQSNAVTDVTTNYAPAAPVPEPATILLLGFGFLGIAGVSRRKKQ
ncbi:MAG: ice-binding family protein [Desulfobacula sp.]|jgi:hypothetical protein|nr:ice-binding family protein [Desulfobacula sp.]